MCSSSNCSNLIEEQIVPSTYEVLKKLFTIIISFQGIIICLELQCYSYLIFFYLVVSVTSIVFRKVGNMVIFSILVV